MRKSKLTLVELDRMKRSGQKISWITAYDLPLAYAAEQAGVDMILVGDSGAMVQLGHQTTNPVTMEEMLILAQSARRGAANTFIVGDMPQGSYEPCERDAVRNAIRFVKEAGCDAIKLEGGKRMSKRAQSIADAGILVFGHLGLTPQSAATFGGYRVQCKSRESFERTMEDALVLQEAGVCALLLEAMPAAPAGQIAKHLKIPVLGIGAGEQVDGQLVIMHDVLGLYQAFRPKFAKCYVPDVLPEFEKSLKQAGDLKRLGREERQDGLLALAQLAVRKYVDEVRAVKFPSADYSYELSNKELDSLMESEYWDDGPDPSARSKSA